MKTLRVHECIISTRKVLPIFALGVPILWLYLLEPSTFELMWKGRTFQIFFIWLVGLEMMLSWDSLNTIKYVKLLSSRNIIFSIALILPTLYVWTAHFLGLNQAISSWASQNSITWAGSMPLSSEYLVFSLLFTLVTLMAFGVKGLKTLAVPSFFLLIVGTIYTIDNVYPYGQFAPFQIFVPTTTTLAATFLNLMGYSTNITYVQSSLQGTMPILSATNPQNMASASFSIAWPCAGIESFLIFTVVILLFLKRLNINLKAKIGYFVFGASIAYIINSLRIVNIFLVGMVYGENSVQVQNIHFYYGPLYAVTWIVSYPIVVILIQKFWETIKTRRLVNQSQLL
jgi:exosortase/archaeosortase family protein